MLIVDYRAGSHELVEPLQALGLDVIESELAFGDLAFTGRGVGDKPIDIGVEFKKLDECVASMRNGRLTGHQLPGMRGAQEGSTPLYDHAWLLVEGDILYDSRGRLQKRVGRAFNAPIVGGMTVTELYKRLLSIQTGWGIPWMLTKNRADTLKFIEALYRTWTDRAQDEHQSHLGLYQPDALVPVSAFRRTVATLPGISLATSAAVEKRFKGSLTAAVVAPAKVWAEIEIVDKRGNSKRLGMKRAEKIKEAIA